MQTTQQTSDAGLDHLATELGQAPQEQGMHPGWLLAIVTVVAIVGYMLFDGFKSETYFYEVDQAVAQGSALIGQEVRVKGNVEAGSVKMQPGQLASAFRISERGQSLSVVYEKALPDTFKEDMEVVVTGTVGAGYVLHADEVLVKCPSRYEGAPPTGQPEDALNSPIVR